MRVYGRAPHQLRLKSNGNDQAVLVATDVEHKALAHLVHAGKRGLELAKTTIGPALYQAPEVLQGLRPGAE